jgi:5-hydroxyisourate hydrolase-like protein (transthyretin family)
LSAAGPRTIEVTELPARRPVVRREASTRTQIVTFEHIPAGPLEVTLAVPPWRFAERVDLSDGADGEVVFQPSPIEVRGTVYRGTEEHPATVTFLTDPTSPEGRLVAATDEAGSYRATFFRDGYFAVLVELSDRSGRPYFEYLRQPIAETPILDFRLPANTFTVEVVDAASGEPIADAEVTAANRSSRPGEIHRSNRQRTDSDGRVTLSPQQEGELRIVAEADGYHRSEPREVSVTGGEEERQIRIALRSYGATSELTLLLPDGRPAPGAELLALGAIAVELPLWRGRTDEEGRTRLPEEAEGALLVARHPEAAFLLRRWRKPGVDGSPTVWRLEPPAPPLSVVVRSPWGEPAPWSRIVVEVDGVVLRGFLLRWLAETGSADAEGFWQAHHLPPRPLRLAAWAPGRQPIAGGFPEPFAVSVAFPWAGVIELQAID